MSQRLILTLLLVPVLWVVASAAALAEPVVSMGMTTTDLFFRVINSMPLIVLAIAFGAWLMATVFIRIMEFTQPERVRLTALWKELDHEKAQVKALERHVGYLIVLVRELEKALEECTKTCPDCKGLVDKAISIAREKAQARGMLVPGEEATLAEAG